MLEYQDFEQQLFRDVNSDRSVKPLDCGLEEKVTRLEKYIEFHDRFYCYHITPTKNVDAILKNGFKFKIEGTSCGSSFEHINDWYQNYLSHLTKTHHNSTLLKIGFDNFGLIDFNDIEAELLDDLYEDYQHQYFNRLNTRYNDHLDVVSQLKVHYWSISVARTVMLNVYNKKINGSLYRQTPVIDVSLDQVNLFEFQNLKVRNLGNVKDIFN